MTTSDNTDQRTTRTVTNQLRDVVFGRGRNLNIRRHPPSFVCPLSLQVMKDPVMTLCAHNFEREEIYAWLEAGNACCPISRKPLSLEELTTNHTLAERIERWEWKKEHADIVLQGQTLGNTIQSVKTEEMDDEDSTTLEAKTADLELGKKIKQKKYKLKSYQDIPVEFTLLPQEREALQVARHHAAEEEILYKKRVCWRRLARSIAIFVIVVSIVTLGLVLRRYWDGTKEN